MVMKATYVVLSLAAIGLLAVEAPHASWLTSTPERGKVERKTNPKGGTVRMPVFVFLAGYHGGK